MSCNVPVRKMWNTRRTSGVTVSTKKYIVVERETLTEVKKGTLFYLQDICCASLRMDGRLSVLCFFGSELVWSRSSCSVN